MVSSLDELDRLLKMLRAQGATSFKHNGLEVCLGDPPVTEEQRKQIEETQTTFPSQSELDRAVGLPVMGLDDPFLTYNERLPSEDEVTE